MLSQVWSELHLTPSVEALAIGPTPNTRAEQMAYDLTLTAGERKAFDWVGGRYPTGHEVASLLVECLPEDAEWSQEGDITFDVPEHIAWQINDIAEDCDHHWESFGRDLTKKMTDFTDAIV